MATLRLLLAAASAAALAAGPAAAYSFQPIATGLPSLTCVTTAPDDPSTLYVVERAGRIVTVRDGTVTGTFLDISDRVWSEGEGGLLSVAFHPRYAQNHRFYVDYTDLDRDTHVVEYTAANGAADPASARELLFVEQVYPNHKGGQLAFDRRGLLYVGMGDGGSNPDAPLLNDPDDRAQDPATMLGKLLRLDPLASTTWRTIGSGLRNPWRFSFDRQTGDLWLGDVGAGGYEEVNYRPRAKVATPANFGWSRFEGPAIYNAKIKLRGKGKLTPPVWTYGHQFGSCSIVGGYVYRGARLPAVRGRYFFGDFCSGTIWSFRVGKQGRASRAVNAGFKVPDLTSFGEAANGELYAVSLDGTLYALR